MEFDPVKLNKDVAAAVERKLAKYATEMKNDVNMRTDQSVIQAKTYTQVDGAIQHKPSAIDKPSDDVQPTTSLKGVALNG